MSGTTVTIGALPEATVVGPGDVTVLEASGATKKMLVTNLLASSSAALSAHIASTSAHGAVQITATPTAPLGGSNVQAQLSAAAALLASLPSTNVTVAAHPPILASSTTLQAAINTICDAIFTLQTTINGGTA